MYPRTTWMETSSYPAADMTTVAVRSVELSKMLWPYWQLLITCTLCVRCSESASKFCYYRQILFLLMLKYSWSENVQVLCSIRCLLSAAEVWLDVAHASRGGKQPTTPAPSADIRTQIYTRYPGGTMRFSVLAVYYDVEVACVANVVWRISA